MKKNILILFGGSTPEHEVSIITGIQVLENINQSKFNPLSVYLDQNNVFYYLPNLKTRKDFLKTKRVACQLIQTPKGPILEIAGVIKKKVSIDAAYLAFHGGTGEGGAIQGMMEIFDIPFTSPGSESSTISMNKAITKMLAHANNIPTLPGRSVYRWDLKSKKEKKQEIKNIVKELGLPVIIKPAHLGSSIGIKVVKTKITLEKALITANFMDQEILVEKCLKDFEEYNCSAIRVGKKIILSEIERPIKEDEVLSFSDKYSKGGKKQVGGMASLSRELPAKISVSLEKEIKTLTRKAYEVCRCSGLVRIDFMFDKKTKKLYFPEINTIPGSMSFYLWEASGLSFEKQITRSVGQAIKDHQKRKSLRLKYQSNIVERFVNSKDQ